jgi:hypothetical protein
MNKLIKFLIENNNKDFQILLNNIELEILEKVLNEELIRTPRIDSDFIYKLNKIIKGRENE